jgi:hypothetical protein
MKLFVTKILFKIKLNLDSMMGLIGLGTFNVHPIYNMLFYNHKVAYWVTCAINKGKQNGNNKLCHLHGSSPLSFDMFLSLKYSIIIFFG